MDDEKFAVNVIARGSYIDQPYGDNDDRYRVEVVVVRLNHVALNEWLMTHDHNSRECYANGLIGDCEWAVHLDEKTQSAEAWKLKLLAATGIKLKPEGEGISITQAQSEVFTVVRIRKVG